MNFSIELRPHIGVRRERGVEVQVEMEQYLIFVSGGEDFKRLRGRSAEHIGYVGKAAGCPINYLKVAAAFGEPSMRIFDQMIRAALVEKIRERVAAARHATDEAQALRDEAEKLVFEFSGNQEEEAAAAEAKQLAEDAIVAARVELVDANSNLQAEQQSERGANQPAAEFFNRSGSEKSDGTPMATGNLGDEAKANSQNL